jgi:mRNA-degrading endonuclease RelE of RelBE toxin-antitoxin system
MDYKFVETSFFEKELKRLAKKHSSLKVDIEKLQDDILNNRLSNYDDLGNGLKKIRLKITSKGKGKSGGARVVTQETIVSITDKTVLMVAIWDKSEIPNIKTAILKEIVQEFSED